MGEDGGGGEGTRGSCQLGLCSFLLPPFTNLFFFVSVHFVTNKLN